MNIDYIDNMLFMMEKIKDLRDKIIIVDILTFKYKEVMVFGLKALMVMLLLIEIQFINYFRKN